MQSDAALVRVVEDGDGSVVGCAASVHQPSQWFVDDVAIAHDALWDGPGLALLVAVEERPALTCVPSADRARAAAAQSAGLRHTSSYWICDTTAGADDRTAASSQSQDQSQSVPASTPPPPPHTFGAIGSGRPGELVMVGSSGLVVGSPSVPAPPVYDPGGTVCIIDRVVGPDQTLLLRDALAVAGERGDVLVAVVAASDDVDLQRALAQVGCVRTVDVYVWP